MMTSEEQDRLRQRIDRRWTLFLDRDGVINYNWNDRYVSRWDDFMFRPDTLEALRGLARVFHKIVVVTNQQGIGKGLMTEDDLFAVHRQMQAEIEAAGGRIDAVYFAPQLAAENHPMRKPNSGMAELARHEHPSISFEQSIVCGDKASDMALGRAIGAVCVGIGEGQLPEADLMFVGLGAFWEWLRE